MYLYVVDSTVHVQCHVIQLALVYSSLVKVKDNQVEYFLVSCTIV